MIEQNVGHHFTQKYTHTHTNNKNMNPRKDNWNLKDQLNIDFIWKS